MEEKSRIDELLALVSEQNKFQRKVMNSLEEQLSPEEKCEAGRYSGAPGGLLPQICSGYHGGTDLLH